MMFEMPLDFEIEYKGVRIFLSHLDFPVVLDHDMNWTLTRIRRVITYFVIPESSS